MRILIVEDEQLVADDLRETLEYLGYTIVALVVSGEDAILAVESVLPDLVLMDIRLAGKMDGIEASELIQSRFHLPVVYLTANADRATLERVKSTHPFGYILKPFDERTLAITIEIALSRHKAEVEVLHALSTAQADKQAAQLQTQTKSQYLCMAAHELLNPVATIKLGSELLKQYGNQVSEHKKQKYIERIESATNSLSYLLEDILTLGQTETGIQYTPILMDVVAFCQELVEAFQINIAEQHTLIFSTQSDERIACLDEKLLWHLLTNLLSNAIKYSPTGGVVTLTLSRDEDSICFKVQDQGIGIPSTAQAKLFEPFHRANNVGKIPGTGLGLAIVKQCVDLHGGQIRVESVVNQGTAFIVSLPLKGEQCDFVR